jgi:hypothetical protein
MVTSKRVNGVEERGGVGANKVGFIFPSAKRFGDQEFFNLFKVIRRFRS